MTIGCYNRLATTHRVHDISPILPHVVAESTWACIYIIINMYIMHYTVQCVYMCYPHSDHTNVGLVFIRWCHCCTTEAIRSETTGTVSHSPSGSRSV